jgi:CRP/FNR family cyclic AMP-dependent transcriptional regulator
MRKALQFLSILNDSDIDWLISAGNRRELASGANLIEEGRVPDSIFLVVEGAFSVRNRGGELYRMLTGEMAGEMSFVDSAPASATVQAVERCSILAVPRRRLNAKLLQDAAFAARFYHALCMLLSERLRGANALGSGQTPATADEGLADDETDGIGIAGARFDWNPRAKTLPR